MCSDTSWTRASASWSVPLPYSWVSWRAWSPLVFVATVTTWKNSSRRRNGEYGTKQLRLGTTTLACRRGELPCEGARSLDRAQLRDMSSRILSTYAGAATKRGQGIINRRAEQHGRQLLMTGIPPASSRGLPSECAAVTKGGVHRDGHLAIPPGNPLILRLLPGCGAIHPRHGALQRPLRSRRGLLSAPYK